MSSKASFPSSTCHIFPDVPQTSATPCFIPHCLFLLSQHSFAETSPNGLVYILPLFQCQSILYPHLTSVLLGTNHILVCYKVCVFYTDCFLSYPIYFHTTISIVTVMMCWLLCCRYWQRIWHTAEINLVLIAWQINSFFKKEIFCIYLKYNHNVFICLYFEDLILNFKVCECVCFCINMCTCPHKYVQLPTE